MTLLLAACATTEAPVVTRVETKTVSVPVAVPCVKAADIPEAPKFTPPRAGSDFKQKNAALLEYTLQLESALGRSRAKLEGCAAP